MLAEVDKPQICLSASWRCKRADGQVPSQGPQAQDPGAAQASVQVRRQETLMSQLEASWEGEHSLTEFCPSTDRWGGECAPRLTSSGTIV